MGNAKSVRLHYENASRTGVFTLKDAKLKEFPEDLVKLAAQIRSLDLSDNRIKDIPNFLSRFSSLKHIILNNNLIIELPNEIGNLTKLETLSLSSNRLQSIPKDLSRLTALRIVNLNDNHLTEFPMAMVKLKNLEVLDLSHNKIKAIPDGVQDLQALEVNLNQNQISAISEDIAHCKRLKVLRLEENCLNLSALPTSILTDSQISLLAVDGNLFKIKEFQNLPGYESYLERFTATKKKML